MTPLACGFGPSGPDHVWSYDFVEDRTHNGRNFRMLNVIDEFTRECLAIRIDRKLKSTDVIDVLSDLFILRGVPGHVRSDNSPRVHRQNCRGGSQDRVHRARQPLGERLLREIQTPSSVPLPNGSFSTASPRRKSSSRADDSTYNTQRPHTSLGYKPPAAQH